MPLKVAKPLRSVYPLAGWVLSDWQLLKDVRVA